MDHPVTVGPGGLLARVVDVEFVAGFVLQEATDLWSMVLLVQDEAELAVLESPRVLTQVLLVQQSAGHPSLLESADMGCQPFQQEGVVHRSLNRRCLEA